MGIFEGFVKMKYYEIHEILFSTKNTKDTKNKKSEEIIFPAHLFHSSTSYRPKNLTEKKRGICGISEYTENILKNFQQKSWRNGNGNYFPLFISVYSEIPCIPRFFLIKF